jgi:hypothetical protein
MSLMHEILARPPRDSATLFTFVVPRSSPMKQAFLMAVESIITR